jgi:adenine-specific DNA-methyltransferase
MPKQRLELTWIGKNNKPKLEPRILIEDPDKSFGSSDTENMLIHGDNLLALKALEQDYAGKIKCIYIDPPYNTGNAFEHYDDGLEHSIWLNLMKDRLTILRNLLSYDGFLICQIDEAEGYYLKVLLDEIFGRLNFLTTFYVQVRYGNKTLAEDNDYQKLIEQCFIYAKDKTICKPNKPREEYKVEKFTWKIIETGKPIPLELGGKKVELFKPGTYEIVKIDPSYTGLKETWATGSLIKQKASSGEFLHLNISPRRDLDGLSCLYKVYGIGEDGLGYRYFTGPKKATATKGKFYSGIPLKTLEKLKAGESLKEKPIVNFYDMAGYFGNCRHEGNADFRSGKKPERWISIILNYFSNKGDLVLDSFLGSGTTAAVAHKMERKWIGIELGDHCYSLCEPRIRSVVDGADKSGISKETNWKGGGGYKFYELAPSLLNRDTYGNWVINKKYNADMLAAAMAKQEGFTYKPDPDIYWKQGQSTEQDYIFTTTEFLTQEHVEYIHGQMKEGESLLICCKAFSANDSRYSNITIKKIPQMLMGKCEFGKDDYSLNIINIPTEDDDYTEEDDNPDSAPEQKAKYIAGQGELFDMEGDNE